MCCGTASASPTRPRPRTSPRKPCCNAFSTTSRFRERWVLFGGWVVRWFKRRSSRAQGFLSSTIQPPNHHQRGQGVHGIVSEPFGIALVGCGTVGSGVAKLLLRHPERLAARAGRPLEL